MQTLIQNATLILPDRAIEGGWLLIEDERILDLGECTTCPTSAHTIVDATGQMLLPGLIDLHCDGIEKFVEPRPNVHFDFPIALAEADLRLAGNGITTEFHAISLDDNEFGIIRTATFLHDFARALQLMQADLLVRHKIHARLELTSDRGCEVVAQAIEEQTCSMISLMDHSPGQGQFRTEQALRDYIAGTTSWSDTEIEPVLEMKRRQVAGIPQRVERITQLARQKRVPIATHDDDTATKVQQWVPFGVTMSEFPTTLEAAREAHALGFNVCMGAPNVLRGRSSSGNLSALEAIQSGVADILCSDYYPSAMLHAPFSLAKHGVLTLPQAVRLVTWHPAQAVGLDSEYGTLEVGKVADVILVRLSRLGVPHIQRVFIQGEERFQRASTS